MSAISCARGQARSVNDPVREGGLVIGRHLVEATYRCGGTTLGLPDYVAAPLHRLRYDLGVFLPLFM